MFELYEDRPGTTIALELKDCSPGLLFQDQAPTLFKLVEELAGLYDIAMPNLTLVDTNEFYAEQHGFTTNIAIPYKSALILTNNYDTPGWETYIIDLQKTHPSIHERVAFAYAQLSA